MRWTGFLCSRNRHEPCGKSEEETETSGLYLDHQLALVEPGLELFDHFGSELKPGPRVIVHGRGWGTDYLEVRVALEQDFCRASIIFKVHLIVNRGRAQSKRGRNGVIFYENRLLLLLGIRIHGF